MISLLTKLGEERKMRDFISACQVGDIATVMNLVREGCDANKTDEDEGGTTGIMWAIVKKHTSVAEYLCTLPSINYNKVNKNDWTVLHFACEFGVSETVMRTIVNNVNTSTTNKKTKLGDSALDLAVKKNNLLAVSILGQRRDIVMDTDKLIQTAR